MVADNTADHTRRVVRSLGGPAKVGRACGVQRQTVGAWRRVPLRHVPTLVLLSAGKLSPEQIRTDLAPLLLAEHARWERVQRLPGPAAAEQAEQ